MAKGNNADYLNAAKQFMYSLREYAFAMDACDYNLALRHADNIRDIGLAFGSEAWNLGVKNAERKKRK
jgi:hypothetical protein